MVLNLFLSLGALLVWGTVLQTTMPVCWGEEQLIANCPIATSSPPFRLLQLFQAHREKFGCLFFPICDNRESFDTPMELFCFGVLCPLSCLNGGIYGKSVHRGCPLEFFFCIDGTSNMSVSFSCFFLHTLVFLLLFGKMQHLWRISGPGHRCP